MCFGTFNKMLEPFYSFFFLLWTKSLKAHYSVCVSVLFIFQELIDEIGVVNTSFFMSFQFTW